MELTIIIVLALLLAISVYANFNQIRKQEEKEEYIEDLEKSNTEYYTFYQELKNRIGESNSRLKQIDRLGSFESDDETGHIFQELKDIMDKLNNGV